MVFRNERIQVDLKKLSAVERPPRLFTETGFSFWTDPYISRHILHAHLDPTTEDASRSPRIIRATADWISTLSGLPGQHGTGSPRLLDLACGPGLYCVEFARRGFEVRGVDFSASSIEYAQSHCEGLPITYECADYRNVRLAASSRDAAQYDVVTLIFGEFCVMTDAERDRMLARIAGGLRRGGRFIFDVFTRAYTTRTALATGWYTSHKDGFWMPGPHLVFEKSVDYEAHDVNLNQYIVAGADAEVRVYNIWRHHYTPQSVTAVLEKAGFHVSGLFADLTGTRLEQAKEWIGVIAEKP